MLSSQVAGGQDMIIFIWFFSIIVLSIIIGEIRHRWLKRKYNSYFEYLLSEEMAKKLR